MAVPIKDSTSPRNVNHDFKVHTIVRVGDLRFSRRYVEG